MTKKKSATSGDGSGVQSWKMKNVWAIIFARLTRRDTYKVLQSCSCCVVEMFVFVLHFYCILCITELLHSKKKNRKRINNGKTCTFVDVVLRPRNAPDCTDFNVDFQGGMPPDPIIRREKCSLFIVFRNTSRTRQIAQILI